MRRPKKLQFSWSKRRLWRIVIIYIWHQFEIMILTKSGTEFDEKRNKKKNLHLSDKPGNLIF